MPKPFNGVIDLDIRESVPDWTPYLADKAPAGAPTDFWLSREGRCIGRDGDDAYVDRERHLEAAIARD